MFSIASFLDSVKARAHIESDYRLSKVLGITASVLSGYRHSVSLPNEIIIEKLCALSGDDPDLIAAQVAALRAPAGPARALWLRVSSRMSGAASAGIMSVCFAIGLIASGAQDARAFEYQADTADSVRFLYIVSSAILSVGTFLMVRLRFWLLAALVFA